MSWRRFSEMLLKFNGRNINDEKELLFNKLGRPITVLATSVEKSWVARWFVFKPKIQIWVNFGGP
jgi:hypothetical protein